MSTCSTATSTLRGHETRRRRRVPPETCDAAAVEAVHGRLERRLVDLERDWDAYKTGHSGAPRHRHRRSRSATATPSSAVTTVAAPDAALLLPLYRCSSPRTLVSSLQQIGSTDTDSGRAAAMIVVLGGAGYSPARSYEGGGGLSSVCSVEAGHSAAAAPSSSCSWPCRCAACCCRSYSTTTRSSRAAAAAASPFSSAAGGAVVRERARKSDEGRPVPGTVKAAWISAVALVVVGFVIVAVVILELRVGEGCAEYLVPT